MEDKDSLKEIMRRLTNLEQHVINLIIPIQNIAQCLKSNTDIEHLIQALKGPIPINDSKLKMILSDFEREMKTFEKNLDKYDELNKENALGEMKYIGKRLNEIEITLKKIHEDGLTKNIQLDFTCDGYHLVKKPVGYDSKEPIENPDEGLDELLNTFNTREAQIIIHRIGLFGQPAKTYDELGKMFDISRERIRQIYAKLLRKCRETKRSELIKKIKNKKFLQQFISVK